MQNVNTFPVVATEDVEGMQQIVVILSDQVR